MLPCNHTEDRETSPPGACSAGELSAIAYQQNSDDIRYTEIEVSSSVQHVGGCLAFVPSMI